MRSHRLAAHTARNDGGTRMVLAVSSSVIGSGADARVQASEGGYARHTPLIQQPE